MTEPIPVPLDHIARWKEHVYWIRAARIVLRTIKDPRPGSALDLADKEYPWEKVSAWSHNYLDAATEHLELWADVVAPYKFAPDYENHVLLRPYLLLARGSLESAAHAVWTLFAETPKACAERHVRLIQRDLGYNSKAWKANGDDTTVIDERTKTLLERVQEKGLVMPSAPSYSGLVEGAATVTKNDPKRWVYLWNAASGAGHGQNWFTTEGYDVEVGEEYEEGYFRTNRVPDPTFITETVGCAVTALDWALFRWLLLAGFDAQKVHKLAVDEVHAAMPKIGVE